MDRALLSETIQEKRKSAEELIVEVLQRAPEEKKEEILHLVQVMELSWTAGAAG